MKWQIVLRTFTEHMTGANFPLLILLGFVMLLTIVFVLWRWGAGFLMALTSVLVACQFTSSAVLSGIALMARFVLVIGLVCYLLFSRRNRLSFSPATAVLFLIPVVMLLNSARAENPLDAMGQGALFLLFYVGLVLGGQKIFGDIRGRTTFVNTLILFTIVVSCIQIPYLVGSYGRFYGTFESAIGYMVVGGTGTVLFFWCGMRQKFWSLLFIFYMTFSALIFITLFMTGGRTAVFGTLFGILAILSRRFKRNVVVFLAIAIILVPIALRVVVSLPGFEFAKERFSSMQTAGRGVKYAVAWHEAKAKPLFGWGTGSSMEKGIILTGGHFHNSYLEWAVEHGIPFAVIMLLLFLWLPIRGMFLMRHCPTEEMKSMANLSTAILVLEFFSSLLGGSLLMTMGILPTYTAIALQEGLRNESRQINSCLEAGNYEDDISYIASIEESAGKPI
jgi:O-antigen ligase